MREAPDQSGQARAACQSAAAPKPPLSRYARPELTASNSKRRSVASLPFMTEPFHSPDEVALPADPARELASALGHSLGLDATARRALQHYLHCIDALERELRLIRQTQSRGGHTPHEGPQPWRESHP